VILSAPHATNKRRQTNCDTLRPPLWVPLWNVWVKRNSDFFILWLYELFKWCSCCYSGAVSNIITIISMIERLMKPSCRSVSKWCKWRKKWNNYLEKIFHIQTLELILLYVKRQLAQLVNFEYNSEASQLQTECSFVLWLCCNNCLAVLKHTIYSILKSREKRELKKCKFLLFFILSFNTKLPFKPEFQRSLRVARKKNFVPNTLFVPINWFF